MTRRQSRNLSLALIAAAASTLGYLPGTADATTKTWLPTGGGSYYAEQPGPNHPFSNAALSDEVFVDGTGKTSRRDVVAGPTRYQAAAVEPGAPTRAVARSRPLAIERSDAVSGSTTGAARGQQAQNDPSKPFSDAWWEAEKLEDARLKAKMNICRGC